MKCPKCLFDNPSDAGLPKIGEGKKDLAALSTCLLRSDILNLFVLAIKDEIAWP